MKIRTWRVGMVALAVSAALGLASPAAYADLSVGSVFGQAKQGQRVKVVSVDTGLTREVTVDANGRFTFTQLPTGRYKVIADNDTREVLVTVGSGTPVNFNVERDAEVIEVVGARISSVDVSSSESSTTFTASQLERLPVGRDVTSVALLAPGTVRGDGGLGNLASFGGASVAENGYYINGFDVTNIRNFLSYANLPFDAIGEQQIRTGGYGAEYGRSLGGVVNLVTKRGTNTWTGGVSTYWRPEGLREHAPDVISKNPDDFNADHPNHYFRYRSQNTADELSYNIYAGGPIVQDRLFVYGLFEGRKDEFDRYTKENSTNVEDTSPFYLVKLDWHITDDHLLEFTAIQNESNPETRFHRNPTGKVYTGEHGGFRKGFKTKNGGDVFIGKYTGYLTEDLTVSLMRGELENTNGFRNGSYGPESSCPTVYDSRTNPGAVGYIGCWDESLFRNVSDPNFGPDTDERTANRIDFEWQLGDHQLRFGYDEEEFVSRSAAKDFEGGIYYRLFKVGPAESRVVRGVTLGPNTDYVRVREFNSGGGAFAVENEAMYIEDSWHLDDWMIYAGLRSESFANMNADGISFVDAKNMIAPRLGFSWDVSGDAKNKLYGSLGRYYIPVASNTNTRASAIEQTLESFYRYDGVLNPNSGAPANGLGQQIGTTTSSGPAVAPNPATVSDPNLEPMYQDELIVGYQTQLNDTLTAGVKAIFREVKNGMDDYCGHDAFAKWAEDNGHENFDPHSLARCFILNPGKDVNISMDLEGDGTLTTVTVPNSYLGLPEYERTYKALEFTLERAKSDGWAMQASYVYAFSEGNVEGYVNSTVDQTDAGITQDFDHSLFEDGASGYLPNDRRHTLKIFGTYDINDEWLVSANLLIQSGRPVSCYGFIPLEGFDPNGTDHEYFPLYAASSFYCLDSNNNRVLGKRGNYGRTPWVKSLDMGVSYTPNWANGDLTFKLAVQNLFNSATVVEYNEVAETNRELQKFDDNFLNDGRHQAPRETTLSVHYRF